MFREDMPIVTLPTDGFTRWFGPNDRPATETELDNVIKPPPSPCDDPWVHRNYAPAFAAAARVVVRGPLRPVLLYDAQSVLCGVVMPTRGPGDGCIPLSKLCAYEWDR